MPYILAPTNALLWAVQLAGTTIETGITRVGELTVTGEDKLFVYSDEENDFLYQMLSEATGYQPLPDTGWLEAGDMYSWQDDIVIVRQSHNRTIYAPTETPSLFLFYQSGAGTFVWIVGEQVYIGIRRMYDDVEYRCIQAHTSQIGWEPPNVPALWQFVAEPSPDWQIGVAYSIDDHVMYGGQEWVCSQAHTSISTWYPGAPGVYLWSLV